MARGVTEEDYGAKNAQSATPGDYADLIMEADRVVNM